jgi:ribosome-binding factor A
MVFVSIFPTTEARAALTFLSRIAGDFRKHLATHAKIHPIPKIEFVLDEGELNRQHLDELSKKL